MVSATSVLLGQAGGVGGAGGMGAGGLSVRLSFIVCCLDMVVLGFVSLK